MKLLITSLRRTFAYLSLDLLRRVEIRHRLIAAFILFSLIPILISGYLSYVESTAAITQKAEIFSKEMVSQVSKNIVWRMEQIETESSNVVLSDSVQDALGQVESSNMGAQSEARQQMTRLLLEHYGAVDFINQKFLLDTHDRVMDTQTFAQLTQGVMRFVKQAPDRNGRPYWGSYANGVGQENIGMVRAIIGKSDNRHMGNLVLVVSPEHFATIFNDTAPDSGAEIYVLDATNHKVIIRADNATETVGDGNDNGVTAEPGLIETIAQHEKYAQQQGASNHTLGNVPGDASGTASPTDAVHTRAGSSNDASDSPRRALSTVVDFVGQRGAPYLAAYANIPGTRWFVVSTIPKKKLMAEAQSVRNQIVLLGLSGFILSIFLAYFISHSISAPLSELVRKMHDTGHDAGADAYLTDGVDRIADTHADTRVVIEGTRDGVTGKDELSRLSGHFERMRAAISQKIQKINEINASLELTVIARTAELWKQANFDALTQLPNRQMFYDRLNEEALLSQISGHPVTVMLIDLDRFKEVNDSLGHDTGDILLIEAAKRIMSCVNETDTVARLGGDEFTVILPGRRDTESIDACAKAIIQMLAEPFKLGTNEAFISASVGITLYPNDATELEVLFKNVDQAMYAAKNAGRNRFSYFTPDLHAAAAKRLRLTSDLRTALQTGQFRVYYQPIVNLATGETHKAEALIRWQHPEHGMISPLDFIPLAEDTGLIVPIGDWIFKQAVNQARQWREQYHPSFQISVNMSPVQIRQDSMICAQWSDYLRQEGMPGESVSVEITEGLLLDAESHAHLLSFRDAGIQISIDDFGTGYSSLAYLKRFDIDYLKIDRSFVQNLGFDADNQALCEAMVMLAHKLGLQVIAEGVETAEQRDFLIAVGCDYAQGYLYSAPIPPEQFQQSVWKDVDRQVEPIAAPLGT
jgi:diguanylate cyclase (GGDEF)-like protein